MGFFDDAVSAVSSVASAVSAPVAAVATSVGNTLESVRTGSEVGRYVGQVSGDIGRVAQSPLEIAYDVTRGDITHANDVGLRSVGSASRLGFGTFGFVSSEDSTQNFLRSKDLDKYSLGYSSDYAGTIGGVNTLAEDGYVSNSDRNSALRYGVKTAAVGGAGYLYNAYGAPSGSTVYGYGKDAAFVGGVVSAISKGDLKSAAGQLGGDSIPGWVTDYLPDGSQISTPVMAGPGSSSTGFASTQKAGVSIVAAIGAAAVIYFLIKKRS